MPIPPPGNRCLLGLPLKFLVGDSDPPFSLFSARVDDESRDRDGVDDMPNIGLNGGVVREPGKSSSVAAAVIDAGSRWDARNLLPNGEFLRPDMEKVGRPTLGQEGRGISKLPERFQRAREQQSGRGGEEKKDASNTAPHLVGTFPRFLRVQTLKTLYFSQGLLLQTSEKRVPRGRSRKNGG